jgi:hypothetical protein
VSLYAGIRRIVEVRIHVKLIEKDRLLSENGKRTKY